ncbi:DUF4129 domain-containing protein [Rubritalea tangerina]|uniref:DUF4129 domain-containing protein n=1 Tax=Rubritalea tangerina TaxID=430798 RepID=A0ABW4Z6P8_9BACT
MRLEKVTAEIRPRGRWESIDLGCALVRENFGKVMGAWFLCVVPLWLVLIAMGQFWPWAEGRPWVAGFLCLWVLPICDRVPLFVLSRRLFGEDTTVSELLRAFPAMVFRRFFVTILAGPLAMGRGLSQPVLELEGLRGKAYTDRVSLLSRSGGEGATQASLIGAVLVLATVFSMSFVFMSVVGLFGDPVVIEEFWVEHVLESDADFIPEPYVWTGLGLLLVAITLIEPFYVGAGFAMYINSRTITEGWDIELAFKRMSERVSRLLESTTKKVSLVLLCSMAFLGGGIEVQAANERLERVLEDEAFTVHRETVEVPKSPDGGDFSLGSGGMAGMGGLAQLIFWGVLAALVVGLIWLIVKNLHTFQRGEQVRVEKQPKIRSVMGMEVAPETLPEDIVEAARRAWEGGERQLALSLLYRGAISWFVHSAELDIDEADTERECLERVVSSRQDSVYFGLLTEHWVRLAYGKVEPEEGDFLRLCHDWPYQTVTPIEGGKL